MKVIVTGGGTGGHIYPAVSIGQTLDEKYKQARIVYVGRKQGMEAELVPKLGMRFEPISITYRKPGLMGLVRHVSSLVGSMARSIQIIQKERPSLVVGTGGYVAWPMVFMASLFGIPTAIHEANAHPGRANKFLSKWVDRVMISFEDVDNSFSSVKAPVLTGNPVRKEFFEADRLKARRELQLPQDRFVVISVGGSGGAKKLNDTMLELMERVNGHEKIHMIHVTGKSYYEKFMLGVKDRGLTFEDNVQVLPYLYDMPSYMAGADLMITRAGASTLSEIAVTGTPAILIPSPNVKDNHQEFNARSMERSGAGIMILESQLDSGRLLDLVEDLSAHPEKSEQIRLACKHIAGADAKKRIAQTLDDLLREKGKIGGKK